MFNFAAKVGKMLTSDPASSIVVVDGDLDEGMVVDPSVSVGKRVGSTLVKVGKVGGPVIVLSGGEVLGGATVIVWFCVCVRISVTHSLETETETETETSVLIVVIVMALVAVTVETQEGFGIHV